jgi:hypothetical protein
MPNQMAMTMTATMMAAHTAGVTHFELPLLGESLAAWSNLIWHLHMREIGVGGRDLAERRLDLVPKRSICPLAVVLRSGRLCGTYRIRRRKAVDQACLEPRVDVPVSAGRLAGIGGVFVVWRGIEFLNHVVPPSHEITPLVSHGSTCRLGRAGTGVYQKTTICR